MQHQYLSKTLGFRLAIGLPLAAGLILGLVIAYNESAMALCLDSVCVQTFFTVYKFPVAIAGLCLPIVAMVAALQRSKEAAAQLDEAQLNNRFGNYIKHRESFDKIVNDYCDRSNESIPRTVYCESGKIYRKVFPESGFNNPAWVGGFDSGAMKDLDSKAALLLIEAGKEDDFNAASFVERLSALTRSLYVAYVKYKVAYCTTDSGDQVSVYVPSNIDERFVLVVCASDAFEIYTLLKNYANSGSIFEYDEALNKAAQKLKRSVSQVRFQKARSWANGDIEVE